MHTCVHTYTCMNIICIRTCIHVYNIHMYEYVKSYAAPTIEIDYCRRCVRLFQIELLLLRRHQYRIPCVYIVICVCCVCVCICVCVCML